MALVIDSASIGQSLVDYQSGWAWQREIHAEVVNHHIPDTVLLLEHSPTYTAGRRTQPHERPTDGTPVVDVDRGGKITWHGPGQLVGYPIIHLPNPMDVISHVRNLEEILIAVCSDFQLDTHRIKGRSGVWVSDSQGDRKVAAIGVRVSQGVTMHGFALNCNNDLTPFNRIIPCGISDAGVTSLSIECASQISVSDVVHSTESHLRRVLEPQLELLV